MKLPRDKKIIFLIDGSSFLYRAYYSLPPMTDKKGHPVRVVYGFCRILKKLINELNPKYLAVAWDTPSEFSEFRRKLYPPYKAQRSAPPVELNAQRDLVKEFASLIGLAQYEKPNEEADDILYSLAKDFSQEDCFVVIVTPDKDLDQAISKSIVTYDTFKERWTDEAGVLNRYGIPVKKFVFYFSLIGDSVDNIPGVQGIGPSVAKRLVNTFSSLTDLYKHLDNVEPQIRPLLQVNKTYAFISQKLFKLYYLPFNTSYTDCAFDINNWGKAREFFEKLNFQSLLKELDKN